MLRTHEGKYWKNIANFKLLSMEITALDRSNYTYSKYHCPGWPLCVLCNGYLLGSGHLWHVGRQGGGKYLRRPWCSSWRSSSWSASSGTSSSLPAPQTIQKKIMNTISSRILSNFIVYSLYKKRTTLLGHTVYDTVFHIYCVQDREIQYVDSLLKLDREHRSYYMSKKPCPIQILITVPKMDRTF